MRTTHVQTFPVFKSLTIFVRTMYAQRIKGRHKPVRTVSAHHKLLFHEA